MSLITKEEQLQVDGLIEKLPELVEEAKYDELYGYQLDPKGDFYDEEVTKTLVIKFLRANKFDLELAKTQLSKTLKWRKEFNPLSAGFSEDHDEKFDIISYITWYEKNSSNEKVVTFNVYGNVTNPKDIFGDLDKFLRWRIGIMEKSIQILNFKDPDNSSMVQLHDYKKLSFLKMDPDVKNGSKATITIFQDYYPELLSEKFFVNIPTILSWVYLFVSRFVSEETRKKFKVLGNGTDVAKYLGDQIPKEYGGKSKQSLKEQRFDFDNSNKEFQLSEYAAFLLSKQFTEELD
ncbi:hypothetical protein PACTADRAFT_4014 [Pachysolen tannophilus NRRL Y-2460]|uniref:Phosphatidylinositol transfer protein SFH5 n=1 Tax=Pachysolen tannophilus NRRL Y-2460 TaxID=669874 RepID=A0A1E4TQN3_PACTA|nr:hypothetical protein PACTADRAFT_4014 [Pachysolen tannophilus NRRL Y-2460]